MTSDPIGLGGGLNTFGYVYQNPLIYFDIDAFEPKKYTPPSNPNKRGQDRQNNRNGRDRNAGHGNAEEHNRDNRGRRGGGRGGRSFGPTIPIPLEDFLPCTLKDGVLPAHCQPDPPMC